jgi:RNA polymerase sigma-70 factor (ECF subfamily)
MDTSASLLERLRQRSDQDSWQRLVELYTPRLRSWLRPHLRAADDVEDLVQDVFTVLVRKLPDFVHNGRPGAFRHWLRSIAANHLRSYWRARRDQAPQAEVEAVLEQLADPASALSLEWDREHDYHIARKVLEAIEVEFKPTTWRSFFRVVLEGAPPETVAAELGLSVNAVLIAKSRVLRRVREEIQDLLD